MLARARALRPGDQFEKLELQEITYDKAFDGVIYGEWPDEAVYHPTNEQMESLSLGAATRPPPRSHPRLMYNRFDPRLTQVAVPCERFIRHCHD